MSKEVLIIGAGAAGLTAAICAAREGAKVTVLEHSKKPAQKILATGNGKCNLGNISVHAGHYHSMDPEFVWEVLDYFNASETIHFFTELGIYVKNKEGYLYPQSEQASAVRDVLLMECAHQKVKIKNNEIVINLKQTDTGWAVQTKGWTYECDKVILATGSSASNISGADDSGYTLAEGLGHEIVEPLPALVPLVCTGLDTPRWSGVRIHGSVTLSVNGNLMDTHEGELQLTEYGISGIPVFQISGRAVRALHEGNFVEVKVDFFPDMKQDELEKLMIIREKNCPYKNPKEQWIGLLPDKIIEMLPKDNPVDWLKSIQLTVIGSKSFQYAQVCSGGVALSQVNPKTMESKLCKNLYFAGELLNADGECGGYNLHWAWATGTLAGRSCAL